MALADSAAWAARAKDYDFPMNGINEKRPLCEVMLMASGCMTIVHARNGAHVNTRHFITIVGGVETATTLWDMASLDTVSCGFEIWSVKGDTYHIVFAFAQAQFNGESVKCHMDTYFSIARIIFKDEAAVPTEEPHDARQWQINVQSYITVIRTTSS